MSDKLQHHAFVDESDHSMCVCPCMQPRTLSETISDLIEFGIKFVIVCCSIYILLDTLVARMPDYCSMLASYKPLTNQVQNVPFGSFTSSTRQIQLINTNSIAQ